MALSAEDCKKPRDHRLPAGSPESQSKLKQHGLTDSDCPHRLWNGGVSSNVEAALNLEDNEACITAFDGGTSKFSSPL